MKTYDFDNKAKLVERVVKVRKLTYVEHAKEKYKPVISIFNKNYDENNIKNIHYYGK